MKLSLDERSAREELVPLLDDERVRRGLAELAADPFLLAFFLMTVSQGEGLGEAGVAAIRHQEIAALLHELDRQEREERGHKEGTRELVGRLFPELFEGGRYRYESMLTGAS
jgi:hypothetical protein